MNSYLTRFHDQEFSLEGLVTGARSTLEYLIPAPTDGRVTEYPDSRTIRYYQTIGIVHKPIRYEGRNAVYGYKHLLQVVTVKLLQSRGLSLAQIQRALLNSTTADLETALDDALAEIRPASPAGVRLDEKGLYAPWVEIKPEHPDIPQKDEGRTQIRKMIATEVSPGVMLILDPQKVVDPQALLARIIHFINPHSGGIE
jgi:DNA-binding transcriptional MerR regulator